MPLPILHTARLILKPYTADDIDALHALWVDPDMRRFLWDDVIIPRERAEEVVRESIAEVDRGGFGQWVVVDRETGKIAGFCGFVRRGEDEDLELLYGLAPRFWGRGLATEAAAEALTFVFTEPGHQRVTAATDPPNVASIRVMERLGMRFSRRGTLNGLETVFYEIARADFIARSPSRTVRR